ncbi:MAG: ferritin-like domain-containing protein [Myxococcota bacterium]
MKVDAGYALPFDGSPVEGLLHKRLPDHGIAAPVRLDAVWSPGFFDLDAVPAFRAAPETTQRAILADCARGTLLEAYFIEKAGVSYAAKMILLAPTAEERSLYAMFAAEEAGHLDAMGAALGPSAKDADWQSDPFLGWLRTIVEQADRPTSQLVVQLVLEGWGLKHYASMRDGCHDAALRSVFDRIVADEAAHHGSAVQLLRDTSLDRATVRQAVDLLADLLAMVKMGPARVMGALERGLGGFTAAQRRQAHASMQSDRHVAHRLQILRRCLEKVPAVRPVVAGLVERGGFAGGVT